MKIYVTLVYNSQETIDLKDFGHEDKKWIDLTEDERNEILDPLRENCLPNVSVREIES